MATKLTHLAPPPAFDAESDKSSLAQRWKDWRERFDQWRSQGAARGGDRPPNRKKNIL